MNEVFCETSVISYENIEDISEDKLGLKIFEIKLSSYNHLILEFKKYLNKTELHRAQKYHFEKDRHRFIICRTILKLILAQQTFDEISNINIKIDQNNKPYISSKKAIFFNMSHAGDYAIIAVCCVPVGIDLEYQNKKFDFTEILPSTFSKLEIETILKSTDKTAMFFKLWTRKEAIVKATGKGISDDLIQVPATDGRHSVNPKILTGFKNLQVLSFHLNEDYVAAVAFSNKNMNLDKLLIYNNLSCFDELKSVVKVKKP